VCVCVCVCVVLSRAKPSAESKESSCQPPEGLAYCSWCCVSLSGEGNVSIEPRIGVYHYESVAHH